MASTKLLMIFIKNLRFGKSIFQNEQATEEDIKTSKNQKKMQDRTLLATRSMECDKAVFYSEYLEQEDAWKIAKFQQHLQWGHDFGERMQNAFLLAFKRGYDKVILLSGEGYEITSEIVTEAFEALDKNEIVIGPSTDGGYYLLGMKENHSTVFKNKEWGSENVLLDTIIDIKENKLTYCLLETLNSIKETQLQESFYKTH